MDSQRIILGDGERLEIYLSKPGDKKYYSSIGVGSAEQEGCPEQETDSSVNITWMIVGPAKICFVQMVKK